MAAIKTRPLLATLMALACMAAQDGAASAHVQVTDNGVSAVMHILPEDDPSARDPTYIQFTFGGSKAAFDVGSCSCKLSVTQDGKETERNPVESLDATSGIGHVVVTFPKAGVYNLRLTGFTDSSAEQRFALPYVVRVSPEGQTSNVAGGTNVILVSLASLAVVGIVAYYNISNGLRYTDANVSKAKK